MSLDGDAFGLNEDGDADDIGLFRSMAIRYKIQFSI